jgi:iron complex outermembrane receptor protein
MTKRQRFARTTSAIALIVVGGAAPAFAQTQPAQNVQTQVAGPAEDSGATGADVVVTGTRIARPELDAPNPVEVLTSRDIVNSGETNLTEFLRDSPALVGSLSDEANSGSNTGFQSVGLNLLNLRNLGTQRTLVLVNGRRHVNAYPGENSVDVNTIPIDLVERVDILTGGASAIYGADAVTGVVNFVLKRNFEGIQARFQTGISQLGDGGRQLGSVVVGKNFAEGRGNITLAYEYNNQDRLSQRARDYLGDPAKRFELLRDPSQLGDLDDPNVPDRKLYTNVSWADSAPNGAVDINLDGIPEFDGDGRVYDGGTYLPSSGGRAINSTSNTPTAGYFGDLLPALERHNVNLLGSFEVSDKLRFFVEAKYVKTRSYTEIQPSFDFFTYLAPDNLYLQQRFGDAAPDGAYVSRDNFDLGTSRQRANRDTYRGVFGIDGTLTSGDGSGDLRYELSYVYGRANSTVTDENQRVTDRYYAALDAVVDPASGQLTCRINLPGETIIDPNNYADILQVKGVNVTGAPLSFSPGQCRPLNILGSGQASQAAIDFAFVDSITRARSEQHVVSGSLNGNLGFLFSLPGGPIGFAVGAEYRKETTRSTPSAFQQAGYFDGGSAILPSGGGYDVKEVFGEINAPVLRDRPFFEELSFGAAVRYSDYSTIGSTLTWKVDGTYSPIRDVTLRSTYSQAVRAPNITELFSPRQGTFAFLTDPCDPTVLAEGTSFRAANCQAALTAAGLTPAQIAAFSPSTDPKQSTSQPGLTGGNPNLREETAKTWTAGLVLRPSFLPGFSLTADWYDIRLENAINTPDINDVFKLCVDAPSLDNQFCSQFSRSPTTGFINAFTVQTLNVAAFTTSGLELTMNYAKTLSPTLGSVYFRLSGGYLNDLTFIATVGGVPEQLANVDDDGVNRPRYVGNLDLGWQKGPVSINYGLAWQGRTQRFSNLQLQKPDYAPEALKYYKERWEHDIRVALDVDDRFTLYGGVNNLFDQQPDIAANAGLPVSALGRFLYIGAQVKLPRF